VLIHITAIPKP